MLQRTHHSGLLRAEHIGETVTLNGWVRRRRDQGGVIFIDLWDRSGIVQTVFDSGEQPAAHAVADDCRGEFVVAVRGEVTRRPEGTENANLPTGEVEVRISEAEILNETQTPPFQMSPEVTPDEMTRLRYRYVDLRREYMQRNLRLRHRIIKSCRDFMDEEGFWEIETPCLIRSTPEGARDYVVPDRRLAGKFWALPQSPQLFKQMLQVGGVEKYFQIARCYRDEDLRADRQPEFTQIDAEMSFVTQDDIFSLCERMFAHMYRESIDVELEIPFPRISYAEAIARFGSDKPDTRFGMELQDLTDLFENSELRVFQNVIAQGGQIKGICAPGGGAYSRKQVDGLTAMARDFGAGGLISIQLREEGFRSSIQRYLTDEQVASLSERFGAGAGDMLLIVADQPHVVADVLGRLRLHLGNELGLLDAKAWNFLWVVDFPLFERDEETGGFRAMHHPFSQPQADQIDLLETEPLLVIGQLYDLVVNGCEILSGSIRNHRRDLQERVLAVIGINREQAAQRFGFLLDALGHGAPPHGGFAVGLDRVIALMAGAETMRDVIAFPKTAAGTDLMLEAPNVLDPEQLEELHLQVVPADSDSDS